MWALKRALGVVVGLSLAACHAPTAGGADPATEYRNGQWFDGQRFVAKTMWAGGDTFVESRPRRVGTVVDLKNGFVVPPYADGHNHWLEPTLVDAYVQTHLRDGIFYVKDHGTAPLIHDQMRPVLGGAASVDFISAHQGFTGPDGHPIEIVDALAGAGVLPAEWARTDGEGEALFVVTSEQDIDRAWPRLMAGKPDFVKVFLVHSEEYTSRRDNTALTPKNRGIDPSLVPAIVARTHAAHLRVSAHIENAHDFHVAIAAGVDDIAHMPFVEKDHPDRYRLAEADLRAAAARGVSIATTLDWMREKPTEQQIAVVRDNFAAMRRAGNTIVIGTDQFRQTARVEADLIAGHQLMSNLEILRAWSIATPRAIFPNRRLGRLAGGFEASFLVLGGNPLADFANAHAIVLRVKQGQQIVPRETKLPSLGG
ncbi:MAG: amidohydrolase family protein [Acidobacteria bacterium]|nr:amidohydrolase family protein [Acidobacteriota bacterium]